MPVWEAGLQTANGPVLQAFGLDSGTLTAFLIGLAVVIFLWGFERYRTTFSRQEFLIAIALSLGVFAAGAFPAVYSALAAAFHVERRSLIVSLLANSALVLLVLYLLAQVRSNQLSITELTRDLAVERATETASSDTSTERTVCVVIPAYNEAESIRNVVSSLPESVHDYAVETLVVSDGSTDGTVDRVATTAATAVEHPLNQDRAAHSRRASNSPSNAVRTSSSRSTPMANIRSNSSTRSSRRSPLMKRITWSDHGMRALTNQGTVSPAERESDCSRK